MGCEAFCPRDCYFPFGSLHSRALISLDRRRYSCGQSSSQCFTSSPFDHASHFKRRIFSTTCDGRACICEGFASAYMKIVRHLFQYLRLPLIHPYSMTLQLLPNFLQESASITHRHIAGQSKLQAASHGLIGLGVTFFKAASHGLASHGLATLTRWPV